MSRTEMERLVSVLDEHGIEKTAAQVLQTTARELVTFSMVASQDSEIASMLWRKLFEILMLVEVSENDLRGLLLTRGPALWILLESSVRKVNEALQAPLVCQARRRTSMEYVAKFSLLGSVGMVLVGMTSTSSVERIKRLQEVSSGIALVGAMGTACFAFHDYFLNNRVYKNYNQILEQILTFLGSKEISSQASPSSTGQLELWIARRCGELDIILETLDETLIHLKLSALESSLPKSTMRDLLVRAKILEKVAQLRCLVDSISIAQQKL